MFLLIVLQEENPLSIAKFYTIAKSFSIFYFFSFLVVSLLLLFFHFAKWKEKVFWWYNSEIRNARKLIHLKYEIAQLVFTCSKSTKETLERGGKHVHKKIKNYVNWLTSFWCLVILEHISHPVWWFYGWLWAGKFRLGGSVKILKFLIQVENSLTALQGKVKRLHKWCLHIVYNHKKL